MIRRLWTLTSAGAVLILALAVLGVGWLWVRGDLDADRVASLRAAWEKKAPGEAESVPGPTDALPMAGSSEHILQSREAGARHHLIGRHLLEQEAALRHKQIQVALLEVAEAREELQAEREAFEIIQRQAAAESPTRDQEVQFRRAVQLIESASPGQAKIWLVSMVETGRMMEAVATLDAMRERAASRILREFQSAAEMELAGQLLEALSRYGTAVPVAIDPEQTVRATLPQQPDSGP